MPDIPPPPTNPATTRNKQVRALEEVMVPQIFVLLKGGQRKELNLTVIQFNLFKALKTETAITKGFAL